ncbi:MAG: transcriptional regulator, partial [Planctomycetaceae bacterium]|nr:transcriptional regulator [Planctomycetaceae bacterium]
NQLHRYFIDRSENRYIKEFFASHGGYYTALFDYAALGASVVKEMAEQHREVLSHALARRWAKARKALAHHIRSQQPVSLELIRIMSRHAVK